MKWIKYTLRTTVTNGMDENGNPIEREILTPKAMQDTEENRAAAAGEAYGEITPYDDGEEEAPAASPTLETRVDTLETNSAEMAEALNMILSGVTE